MKRLILTIAILATLPVLVAPANAGRGPFSTSPHSARFDRTPAGGFDVQTVTLTNTGDVSHTLEVLDHADPPFSRNFDDCQSATIPPGGSCTVGFVFQPQAAGRFSDTFVYAGGQGQTLATIKLIGTGTAP